jgi:site-specific DNA recombinase
LEQNFNSLHAQREACEAYILSQTGEGWSQIKTHYDDGGFSGGSMERPGLKQLLIDIGKGHVDVVVVYKVDRLTRSLADFAKIVELFDAKGVSFVSITQAFNTTTSMGRLTLNVLLSFAQFEREVTGERIRDKIAASKAKGLRMGGRPPLGYDIVEGRLAVNNSEADRVRLIFDRYLQLGSVAALAQALEAEGVTGKLWTGRKGVELGGGFMSRGALYHLLSNPAVLGITRHKEKRYENTHPPIIDRTVWDSAQQKLAETNASQPATPKLGEGALLAGLVFDDRGNPMVLVHTKRGTKRYRYYVSKPKLTGRGAAGSLERISAGMLEQFLTARLQGWLSPGWMPDAAVETRLRSAIAQLVVGEDQIVIKAHPPAVRSDVLGSKDAAVEDNGQVALRVAFQMHRRRGEWLLELEGPRDTDERNPDRALIRAITLACTWSREVEAGSPASITEFAERQGLSANYMARLLPLAYLAPDLTAQILEGRQPRNVTLALLTASPPPLSWEEQRRWVRAL